MSGSNTWLPVIVAALMSAGGATFLGSLVRGYSSLRSGARARERETVQDLAQARDEAIGRERAELADSRFWQGVAAKYAYQLRLAGINPDPEQPEPPSERAAREVGRRS